MQYRRLKKQLCCFTAAAAMLGLAACGNGSDSPDTPSPTAPAEGSQAPTAITPTDGPSDNQDNQDNPDNQGGNDDMTDAENALAAKFEGIKLAETLKRDSYNNPVMTQRFGADPYALVYDGRVYLYMTGDIYEYEADGTIKTNSYGKIQGINVISSSDLVNWTDHGTVYVAGRDGSATWANNSWAPAAACKEIDGKMKFFLYFANSGGGIGVLSADSPVGPFVDPIKRALVSHSTPNCAGVTWMFDPAVLMDDDGRAYLYFGGGIPNNQFANPGTARAVELGEDMVSIVGAPVALDVPYLFEDSGINKIGDTYYYSYCTNWNVDEEGAQKYGIRNAHIAYMTSDSPLGPFTFQGSILKNPGDFFGCYGNNHHCMFEFNGNWYITYHTQVLERTIGIDKGYRCTHIDAVTVNEDGTIAPIMATKPGVGGDGYLNPFEKTEAETIHNMAGLNTTQYGAQSTYYGSGNMILNEIHTGDWLMVSGADFGEGAKSFTASVHADEGAYGIIKVCLDKADGDAIAYLEVSPDGSAEFREETCELIAEASGQHKLYFVFYGEGYTVDYWFFQ